MFGLLGFYKLREVLDWLFITFNYGHYFLRLSAHPVAGTEAFET